MSNESLIPPLRRQGNETVEAWDARIRKSSIVVDGDYPCALPGFGLTVWNISELMKTCSDVFDDPSAPIREAVEEAGFSSEEARAYTESIAIPARPLYEVSHCHGHRCSVEGEGFLRYDDAMRAFDQTKGDLVDTWHHERRAGRYHRGLHNIPEDYECSLDIYLAEWDHEEGCWVPTVLTEGPVEEFTYGLNRWNAAGEPFAEELEELRQSPSFESWLSDEERHRWWDELDRKAEQEEKDNTR